MWNDMRQAGMQAIDWLLSALDDEFERMPQGWWLMPLILLAVGALCALALVFGATGVLAWLLASTGAAVVVAWIVGDR